MRALFALLLLVACPSADGEPPPDVPTTEDEQGTLDPAFEADLLEVLQQQFEAHSPPGLVLAVLPHDATAWSAALGTAGDVPMDRSHRVQLGTASETFILAALHAYQSDDFRLGRLADKEAQGMPPSWGVTMLQMLDHTSGVPDHTTHPDFDPAGTWTALQLLDLAAERPTAHGPGQARTYNPTNYTYLSRVIDVLSGTSWQQEVRTRFLDPLGLDNVGVPSGEEGWGPLAGGTDAAVEVRHPSAFVGAASMTASAGQLATWTGALFGGDVLSSQQVFDLTAAPFRQNGQAFGIGVEIVDEDQPTERWVSRGESPGYTAWMAWRPDLQTAVVVASNVDLGEAARTVEEAVWVVVEDHVSEPTGDDDDVVEPPPSINGQWTMQGFQVHDPAGAAAESGHTGVVIGGGWNFDVDGSTPGHITLTSADYSSGSPVDAVECSFDATGSYGPEWGPHGSLGGVMVGTWGSASCPEWPSADSWQGRIAGNLQGPFLVPWDAVPQDWAPTWSGWGGGSIRDHVQGWMATEGQSRGASEVGYVVLGTIEGVTTSEPAITPWTYLGFFWR